MHVLFLAAEAEPFVKIGGLADVAGALPVAIHGISRNIAKINKIDIRMVLPFHFAIKQSGVALKFLGEYFIKKGQLDLRCKVYQSRKGDVPVYFIDGPPLSGNRAVYSQNPLHDGDKFSFFSLAALRLAEFLDWRVDILHTNDWHTAPAIAALKILYRSSKHFSSTKALHTLHNLPFMGGKNFKILSQYLLSPSDDPNLPQWARQLPLPLGLSYTDKIVVVSPNYASEIMTEEHGCGLEGFLQNRKDIVSGILNGIDTTQWNPETDPFISQNFTSHTLNKRSINKHFLLQQYNLPDSERVPLLILISRMDPQKGIDIAVQGLQDCADLPWQAILLGTGDPCLENLVLALQRKFPNRVRTLIEFNTTLAHQLYAGGDILMMPSRFEPCGLSQMIAMCYGCLPLATATGGLKDTIIPIEYGDNVGTGFLFEQPNSASFSESIRQAINIFRDPGQWQQFQKNAMQSDFSWHKSALEYIHEYKALLECRD